MEPVLPAQTPTDLDKPSTRGLPKLFDDIKLGTKQRRFLRAYAEIGTIRGAMLKSGVDTRWHYHWLVRSDGYGVAFERAREMFNSTIEGEIIRRGIHGYDEQLSYKGQLTGHAIKKYSDMLAAIVLKGRIEQYREGSAVAVGPQQINLQVNVQPLHSAVKTSDVDK